MLSPTNRKILVIFPLISLLLLLPNSCSAAAYTQSYTLLDSPEGSTTYRLTVSATETIYEYYRSKDHNLYDYDFSKFVTPDAVKPIADDLWSIYNNSEDFANGVLMMMHQIPYVESTPQKYAIETIVENEGDCDLFSITAASIMNAGGLDVVLLLLEEHEHMMVGVNLPENPQDARSDIYFYQYEGNEYYVAETTGGNWENGWRVGECSDSLQKATAKIIPLKNSETIAPAQVSSSYSIPDSASIQMSLSTNFAISNNGVQITGSISPSLPGETVTLYFNSMSSSLTMLATVVTDSNGQYSHTWQSPPGGILSVRANWAGDENYSGADSTTSKLVVIPFGLLIGGIILATLLVILLAVTLSNRRKPQENQETIEDWDFEDYSEGF